jgi:hypothetical protein
VSGENYIMRSLEICISHRILFGDQIEKNEMDGTCNKYGERSGVYRVVVGKPEGKRPLGRPRCRWEDNIKMDLQEEGWGMNWNDLAQDKDSWRALLNEVMNLQVP